MIFRMMRRRGGAGKGTHYHVGYAGNYGVSGANLRAMRKRNWRGVSGHPSTVLTARCRDWQFVHDG